MTSCRTSLGCILIAHVLLWSGTSRGAHLHPSLYRFDWALWSLGTAALDLIGIHGTWGYRSSFSSLSLHPLLFPFDLISPRGVRYCPPWGFYSHNQHCRKVSSHRRSSRTPTSNTALVLSIFHLQPISVLDCISHPTPPTNHARHHIAVVKMSSAKQRGEPPIRSSWLAYKSLRTCLTCACTTAAWEETESRPSSSPITQRRCDCDCAQEY
jgi:hypothetical protein